MIFSHSTWKAFNSPYMQYYFKQFSVLHSSKVIFSFLIKKSRQQAIEIETAFSQPLGNPKGHTLDHLSALNYLDDFRKCWPIRSCALIISKIFTIQKQS